MRQRQSNGAHFINPDVINIVVGRAVLNAHPAFQPDGDIFGPAMAAPMMHAETIEEVVNGVVHPVTKETITKYQKLVDYSILREIWEMAMCVELGGLTQGFGDTKGTETIRFLELDKIKNIPRDRTVTYARIVVDYRPQKKYPNRVRITVGGNLIEYPYELTTHTADLTTSKIL